MLRHTDSIVSSNYGFVMAYVPSTFNNKIFESVLEKMLEKLHPTPFDDALLS
ncbi:unnamed protein product [Sphenostylis stenocarpa]|uniref:Uncharacterized protein n=1 Tax=Sphenostylis stenocarpa TaxID=92480 RepID=A0AA86S7W2_9FABA|nr:unnamed protein product [Sphenostylis stenocarpa]